MLVYQRVSPADGNIRKNKPLICGRTHGITRILVDFWTSNDTVGAVEVTFVGKSMGISSVGSGAPITTRVIYLGKL